MVYDVTFGRVKNALHSTVDYTLSCSPRAKNVAHSAIDSIIPQSLPIAVIAGFAGWYAHRYTLTYLQQMTFSEIVGKKIKIGDLINFEGGETVNTYHYVKDFELTSILNILFAHEVMGQHDFTWDAVRSAISVALLTSFTLNLVAQKFFNTQNRPKVVVTRT